jgi:Uma2 family endonuclease
MNAQAKHIPTAETFLAWAQAQPKEAGRFEFWDGKVIEKHGPAGTMNAERSQHWRMKAALYRALHAALKASGLAGDTIVDGASVRLPAGRFSEPDVLVYLGPRVPRDALVIDHPIIVCEVLSPSTAQFDLTAKLEGYFALPSVEHYVIGDPDGLLVIHHARTAGSARATRTYRDRNVALILDPPGLTVDLGDVLEP